MTSAVESLEQSWDSTIIQPALAANPNVSVFAPSGDDGAYYGVIYPSASPEVVSVGGTSLSLTQSGQWSSETGWDGSGGGYSQAFSLPSYQQDDGFSGNVNDQRTNPDVAADADPNTGVAVYDPYDFGTATPWDQVGGTSLATPLWAGMAAIADQGRVLAGGTPLGSTAMLTDLYNLANIAPGDFHDITQGNNGYSAGPGYDLVTGLGIAQGQPPHPRPGRLRPGQQGDHRHPAAAQRRRRRQFRHHRLGHGLLRRHRPRLQRHRDPLAGQRPERGHLHAGDRPGHRRPGGLPEPVAEQEGQRLHLPGHDDRPGVDHDQPRRRDAPRRRGRATSIRCPWPTAWGPTSPRPTRIASPATSSRSPSPASPTR